MAHHSGYPMDQDPSDFEKLLKDMGIKKAPTHPLGLGATGKFPEGKLNHNDEGEIALGITTKDGKIVMDFGKPTHWIGFTKEQALMIASSLIERANNLS
jgi:hypothetical protein